MKKALNPTVVSLTKSRIEQQNQLGLMDFDG
jgi:hypothetical protein